MHVIWICGSPVMGGAERSTCSLLLALRERGHRISALCPVGELSAFLAGTAIEHRIAPLGTALDVRAIGIIAGALRSARADVALVTTPHEWLWSCLAPRRRTRLVLVRHMVLPLRRTLGRLVNTRADAVIAVSEAVRQVLLQRVGITPALLRMIRNPVRYAPRADPPTRVERTRARQALGLSGEGRYVAFLGGLRSDKGIADLARAVAHVPPAIGPVRVIACGRASAAEQDAAHRRTMAEGIVDRFHYLGHIEQIECVLTAADALVVATGSALGEAAPLSISEAMTCGTPVIAYDTGGVAELLGDSGRLVPAGNIDALTDAVGEILSNATTTEQLARAAMARVEQLCGTAQTVDRFEDLLHELVDPLAK